MTTSEFAKLARRFCKPYRIDQGRKFRLKDFDPEDTGGLKSEDKPRAKEALELGVQALARLQDVLFAQDRWSLLVILQAMDAAGKDSAIKHVMSGANPQGCDVTSFKAPTSVELDHDFLWRTHLRAPRRGHIGIFNRSYYEEVLVVRVHEEILHAQKLPPQLVTKHVWEERYEDIRAFERYLARNGTVIRKIFLHVSKAEQKRRFLERIEQPEKNWKFSLEDVRDRAHWNRYMRAYEDAVRATATAEAPWYVVPADNKWFTRLVVAAVIVDALQSLDLRYPEPSEPHREQLKEAKAMLEAER